jgi:beta-lactamase family protein
MPLGTTIHRFHGPRRQVRRFARNGKVAYLQAVGFYDRAKSRPLQPDAIFWIASMTKPVTSVAAMMLVEEGKLDLDAQVPGLFTRPSGDCRLVDVIGNMIRRSEPGHSTWRLT